MRAPKGLSSRSAVSTIFFNFTLLRSIHFMNKIRYPLIKMKYASALLVMFIAYQRAWAAMPETPPPNEGQFAIELFRIETPHVFNETTFIKNGVSIEDLFANSENLTQSFPVVYSALGVTAVCDQTKKEKLVSDCSLINGKVVPVHKVYSLGIKAEITILNLKQNLATYTLNFSYNDLKGYDEYVLKDDIKAKKPVFETRQISTQLNQSLGAWLVLGGFSSSHKERIQSTYYLIRITKPQGTRGF
ncbi:hypothetical protein P4C99_05205 [Pontiellaceae bacterium B1224]|nr:hypothetical protein [Pontiellaceae bacterium B1224]